LDGTIVYIRLAMATRETEPRTGDAFRLRDVQANGVRLSVREWGREGRPPLVFVAGTGLSASIFAGAERLMAEDWHGFSVDRRGQGLSEKPAGGYDWTDSADDLAALVEALDLRKITGIGHSAGGTDVLLAAAADPARWRSLVAIEPTLQDPRRPPLPETEPPSWQESFERSLRRRDTWDSLEHAIERFSTNPWYARCNPQAVRQYLAEALEPLSDGPVTLRCPRAVEAEMNRQVMRAMHHRYTPPPGRDDPFAALAALSLPTTLVTMGHSGEVYAEMARIGLSLVPGVRHVHLPDYGHLLPLEAPAALAQLAAAAAD
jgi:pimeloyl-ACP methyl ester carboxylesterase